VAVSGGAFAGVSLSGAGAAGENRIAMLVQAFIDGDGPLGIEADSINLLANDTSRIDAIVGTASIAAGFGMAGVGVSVGVALAWNDVSSQVAAYITNGNPGIEARTGKIRTLAIENATIDATAVAASAGAGVGFVGIGFSLAGAYALNAIHTQTNAFVAGSDLTAGNDVTVSAQNTSTIDALIASVSAGIGGGAVGAGISIGFSLAENLVGWSMDGSPTAKVQAYITGSSVQAGGDLLVSATNNASVEAEVDAVSVAIGGGLVAIAASAAALDVVNKMSVATLAYIANTIDDGISVAGDVTVRALESSSIDAEAHAVSVATSFGLIGSSIAIGISLAENTISNVVEAYLSAADVHTNTGDLTVTANETATIDASSSASAFAFTVSIGTAFSGGGVYTGVTIETETRAYVNGGILTPGGDLTVAATSTSDARAEVKAMAISGGLIANAAAG